MSTSSRHKRRGRNDDDERDNVKRRRGESEGGERDRRGRADQMSGTSGGGTGDMDAGGSSRSTLSNALGGRAGAAAAGAGAAATGGTPSAGPGGAPGGAPDQLEATGKPSVLW